MDSYRRGTWNEILMDSLDDQTRQAVRDLVKAAGESAKVDEHGSWQFGIETNRRGRGEALNWGLYAVGHDVHTKRFLIVVQIRKTRITKYGNSCRKNYFLVGTNEDGTVFAHPVSANVIHAAIRHERDVVRATQDWIFGGDYSSMWRQGDLALIRVPRGSGETLPENEIVLEDSHRLTGDEMRRNGNLYVRNPVMVHVPGTHPRIEARGWYRVIIGKRAPFWPFAAPTAD